MSQRMVDLVNSFPVVGNRLDTDITRWSGAFIVDPKRTAVDLQFHVRFRATRYRIRTVRVEPRD